MWLKGADVTLAPAAAHLPLTIDHVSKRYAGKPVLDAVNFSLSSGEIFGLVGLNGAGKTTLIKIMLDLASADSGRVQWFGRDALQASSRRCLSYLPEKFQPSRYLKGYEYLALSLEYYGVPLDKDAARDMAFMLDLNPDVLAQRVGSYSKGMGQKLGLLAALLSDTPVLVLDEPMSGLDPRARIRLKAALQNAKAKGKTIFFSSHILSDLDEICDRIAVLHDTRIRYVGTPAQFRANHGGGALEQAFLASIEQVA